MGAVGFAGPVLVLNAVDPVGREPSSRRTTASCTWGQGAPGIRAAVIAVQRDGVVAHQVDVAAVALDPVDRCGVRVDRPGRADSQHIGRVAGDRAELTCACAGDDPHLGVGPAVDGPGFGRVRQGACGTRRCGTVHEALPAWAAGGAPSGDELAVCAECRGQARHTAGCPGIGGAVVAGEPDSARAGVKHPDGAREHLEHGGVVESDRTSWVHGDHRVGPQRVAHDHALVADACARDDAHRVAAQISGQVQAGAGGDGCGCSSRGRRSVRSGRRKHRMQGAARASAKGSGDAAVGGLHPSILVGVVLPHSRGTTEIDDAVVARHGRGLVGDDECPGGSVTSRVGGAVFRRLAVQHFPKVDGKCHGSTHDDVVVDVRGAHVGERVDGVAGVPPADVDLVADGGDCRDGRHRGEGLRSGERHGDVALVRRVDDGAGVCVRARHVLQDRRKQ